MAKKRILVIDDSAIVREPIAITLEGKGYKIFTANNGRDALKFIETQVQALDLLIVDYSMPEMNGISFLDKAKTYPQSKDSKVIFLTDMASKEIVVKAYQSGAHDYMLKSDFSIESLIEKVQSCIG